MKYFKTHLPVEKIRNDIHTVKPDEDKDTCIVEIESKRSIIVTVSKPLAGNLQKDNDYRNIQLSDTDVSVIRIIYRILSISENRKLFGM